jgi:hypothetical protein
MTNHAELFEQNQVYTEAPSLQQVPSAPPAEPTDAIPPPPPEATATSGILPSEFYAPKKPVSRQPAPRPMTGPVTLKAPPRWETSLDVQRVEPASLSAPPRLP